MKRRPRFHRICHHCGSSQSGDFRYGVDSMNGITLTEEEPAVPVDATAGAQDGTASGDEREEFGGFIDVKRESIGHWCSNRMNTRGHLKSS